jgi:hypothetical protein
MAKILLNPTISSISGTINGWVFRNTAHGMVLSARPTFTQPPTRAQLVVRERFTAAAAYAKEAQNDPALWERYGAMARRTGQMPFALAIAGFLKRPKVKSINTSLYHGDVGDGIMIEAVDNFEVAGVKVTIRDRHRRVLEKGAATQMRFGWLYKTSSLIAEGTPITIEAVAQDIPGNADTLRIPFTIAKRPPAPMPVAAPGKRSIVRKAVRPWRRAG